MTAMDSSPTADKRARWVAVRFVLMIGILSFFADFTYEGSRSIIGPFLGTLGATGTVVGIVTGFGELLGYQPVDEIGAGLIRLPRHAGECEADGAWAAAGAADGDAGVVGGAAALPRARLL